MFVERVQTPESGQPFTELEFVDRSRRIADAIEETARLEPVQLFELLVLSLPAELEQAEGALTERFFLWPYGEVIARHGADHPVEGLRACYELTKRFTSEFAIRPILAAHPNALATVAEWVDDDNEHVRRLVSEGTRPRLPWAKRLTLPRDEIVAVLTRLRSDQSSYVRKSVANHLNDLSKDDADGMIELLGGWYRSAADAPAVEGDATRWIVRHALRNQLKQGHLGALAVFGYDPPEVSIERLALSDAQVAIGESITIECDVCSDVDRSQLLMVDLVMGYVKANGSTSPKVFKFREVTLESNATESCSKRFDMVMRNTRKLYPCLLYTSPSPRDATLSRMPSSA